MLRQRLVARLLCIGAWFEFPMEASSQINLSLKDYAAFCMYSSNDPALQINTHHRPFDHVILSK